LTLTEVEGIAGQLGKFEVQIRQWPRYVDMNRCIACGLCAEKCPRKVRNEFDAALGDRKAVYLKYPQTIPLKYAIDAAHCLYFQKGKCRVCEKLCPTGAIDFEEKAQERILQVGSLILAPGFEAFNPSGLDIFGYGRYPNIITSLELECILSASGPFMGHLVRPSDHTPPKKMAFLQCVGSRDIHRTNHGYCSAICCMAAIKEALIAQEHSRTPLEITIFHMDIRTYGKDFEKYLHQAERKGVRFIRCRVHSLYARPGARDLSIRYLNEEGRVREEDFDLVVLSVGLKISEDARKLAGRLGVKLDGHGFVRTSSFAPVETNLPGVYSAGCFSDPKDIPFAVMEASAAAAAAAAGLAESRGALSCLEVFPEEKEVAHEEPRIGVFICNCGTNIGAVVKVPEVVEHAQSLPNVVYVQENLFSCSQDAQEQLKEVIQKQKLNRVVVAACSPRTHEPLFQENLRRSGLNKYLLEMANIRDQCSWVHQDFPQAATEKAKDLVRMSVAKANRISPLAENSVSVTPRALIIGGGLAGMTAALNLARQGFSSHLVEKEDQLGGQARHIRETWKGEDVQAFLEKLIKEVMSEKKITVHLKSEVIGVEGFVGNFKSLLSTEEVIEHGVAILATGAEPSSTAEYLYGHNPKVTLWHELDDFLAKNPDSAKSWKSAVFILCTGSRTPERPYCSRICCTSTLHRALRLKESNPTMEVFILFRDIRTYGQREDLFRQAREKGILFIRYDLENKPKVEAVNGKLQITVTDPIVGLPLVMEPDIVNLATAIIPRDNDGLARRFKVPMNSEKFFVEAHIKLRPVDFATEGIFLCGMAHYPKPIDEAITQALAAASRAATVLSQKSIRTGGVVALINPETCIGCQSCLKVCSYEAITYDPSAHICVVNSALCKGCGACAATCPSGSAQLMGFGSRQLFSMIDQAIGF
jgi:heterodisulfide reductase subunit A